MVKKIRWNGIHLLYRFVCFVFCSGSCDILRGIFLSYNSLYIHVHMTSVKFKRHSSLKVTSLVLKWEDKQTLRKGYMDRKFYQIDLLKYRCILVLIK